MRTSAACKNKFILDWHMLAKWCKEKAGKLIKWGCILLVLTASVLGRWHEKNLPALPYDERYPSLWVDLLRLLISPVHTSLHGSAGHEISVCLCGHAENIDGTKRQDMRHKNRAFTTIICGFFQHLVSFWWILVVEKLTAPAKSYSLESMGSVFQEPLPAK